MKKHLRSTILGCMALLCLLTGCHSSELTEASASVQPTGPIISLPSASDAIESNPFETDAGVQQTSQIENTPIVSDVIQSNPLESENMKAAEEGLLSRSDIQRIYYGSMGTLLISTSDTLYWYDVGRGEILAQRPADHWSDVAFYSSGNTLCAIATSYTGENTGGFVSSSDADTVCIFYDEMLQETETINLSDLRGGRDYIRCAAVSGDGNKIAYATLDKLYCYDRISNTVGLVLDLSRENMEKNHGLSSISSISFAPSANRLLFCGLSFSFPLTGNQSGDMTYGCIDLDGTGLQNLSFQCFEAGSLAGSAGGYLFFEESMKSASGKLAVVDSKDMSQQIYSLGSVREGTSGLFCSQDGAYYATEEVSANKITLRFYDRATGQLACTRIFEDADARYFSRTPSVFIIDSQNLCIVKLGGFNDIPSKVVTFSL